jgi:HAE1 family hydrophobic/amphiphilic exporter-1
MTSFAFIAGLIPLVRATGAGAVGNRTIGSSALGGMLIGTVFGVIIIPGLYYVFGKWSEGKHLIQQEDENPLTEDFMKNKSKAPLVKRIQKLNLIIKAANRKRNTNEK